MPIRVYDRTLVANAGSVQMARIFISYRRKDASADAGRIFDRLKSRFGENNVTLDVDSIPPGVDFRQYIREEVAKCDVLLVIIGDRWLTLLGDEAPADDRTTDWAQFEIETALQRGIPVVPVLVQDAQLASANELPESIRDLSYRNAIEVRAGGSFDGQFKRLVRGIEQTTTSAKPPRRRFAKVFRALAATAAAAAALATAWLFFQSSGGRAPQTTRAVDEAALDVRDASDRAALAADRAADNLGALRVRTTPAQQSVAIGEVARINVRVAGTTSALRGANVTLSAGGGRFLSSANERFSATERLHEPYSISGLTDNNGSFSAAWVCRPCAPGYRLTVRVSHTGYVDHSSNVLVNIE